MNNQRTFSVVVPVYNEEENIERCLSSIVNANCQTDRLEVLVVDGMSDDATREIVREYERTTPQVRLLDNPDRTTPRAMNVGFTESINDVIILLSGHSWIARDFFSQIDEVFDERAPDADVVGGVMVPEPTGYFESAVTGALTSALGSSSTRFQSTEGYVETVNFGAYRREVINDVGQMDETLPRAQDYEYNRRVREHGYSIYQYPEIQVMYRPRSSPKKLAKQYFGNGYWKAHVFQQYNTYSRLTRLRSQTALTVGGLLILFTLLSPGAVAILVATGILYSTMLVLSTKRTIEKNEQLNAKHGPGTICALIIMHVSYTLGFLYALIDESGPGAEK